MQLFSTKSQCQCRVNATTAHLISPTAATGANFVMFLAKLGPEGSAGPPPKGIERRVLYSTQNPYKML